VYCDHEAPSELSLPLSAKQQPGQYASRAYERHRIGWWCDYINRFQLQYTHSIAPPSLSEVQASQRFFVLAKLPDQNKQRSLSKRLKHPAQYAVETALSSCISNWVCLCSTSTQPHVGTARSHLSHNCWWLARELFRSLITHFTPHSKVKVDLLFYCVKREWEQCEASYHSSGRGRVLRGIALVATMPIFPVAWPIIIGGSLITAVTVKVALRRSRKDLDEQVNQYLTGGK